MNENVSPVIDLQKISAYAITNIVDEPGEYDMVNVAEIDTRTLLKGTDLTTSDVTTTGTGTITSSTSSTAVTGVGTSFTTQVAAGNILKKLDGTTIGTVQSVTNDTAIILTGNASVAVSGLGFKVVSAAPVANLTFTNVSGFGVISTNIDSADNQLANADIGKYITITNAHSNVNGTYLITNIQVSEDKTAWLGNPEYDKINITVTPAFTGSATIDMITDLDFAITMQNKFVEDFAPQGATNYANYITRPLSLSVEADTIKVLFDASMLNSSSVKVFYRTWNGTPDLRKIPFVDTGWINDATDVAGVFREREINLTGLTAFRNVQIKIAMRTTNHTQVPLIKNFRLLALS
jgi:hypothetical protein